MPRREFGVMNEPATERDMLNFFEHMGRRSSRSIDPEPTFDVMFAMPAAAVAAMTALFFVLRGKGA